MGNGKNGVENKSWNKSCVFLPDRFLYRGVVQTVVHVLGGVGQKTQKNKSLSVCLVWRTCWLSDKHPHWDEHDVLHVSFLHLPQGVPADTTPSFCGCCGTPRAPAPRAFQSVHQDNTNIFDIKKKGATTSNLQVKRFNDLVFVLFQSLQTECPGLHVTIFAWRRVENCDHHTVMGQRSCASDKAPWNDTGMLSLKHMTQRKHLSSYGHWVASTQIHSVLWAWQHIILSLMKS